MNVTDFGEWYSATYPRLAASLCVIGRDVELGHDAASEACARALERWPRVSELASPDGWAYRVGVNVLRHLAAGERAPGRVPARVESAFEPAELDPWEAVRELPLRQREAIALRYVYGLRQREVAAVMHLSLGAVSSTLVAARSKLARALDPDAPEDPVAAAEIADVD